MTATITSIQHYDLTDPVQARKFVNEFDWGLPQNPTYVTMSEGGDIHFDQMTDDQAVSVAAALLDLAERAGKVRHR